MRVKNEEGYFAQLPAIVNAYNGVSILIPTIHDGTPYVLEMISEHLGVLNYVFAVSNVQDSAVAPTQPLDHPGDLSGTDPAVGIWQFLVRIAVDQVDQVLDLGHCRHRKQLQPLLESEPRQ